MPICNKINKIIRAECNNLVRILYIDMYKPIKLNHYGNDKRAETRNVQERNFSIYH